MKNKDKDKNKLPKVIVANPPTEEQKKQRIKEISESITLLFTLQVREKIANEKNI